MTPFVCAISFINFQVLSLLELGEKGLRKLNIKKKRRASVLQLKLLAIVSNKMNS